MVVQITPKEVVSYCRTILGIRTEMGGVDDILLAALLRRHAGISCPCSRTVLRSALHESLAYIYPDNKELTTRLDKLIDDLLIGGDLLELSDVATDDSDVKGTWVFAAPPAFTMRKNGSAFLTGIVPDQDSFLPASLGERVEYLGVTRTITPRSGEDLEEVLIAQGLHQLPNSVWLKSPTVPTPEELVRRFKQQLAKEPTCGPVKGLEILNTSIPVKYYRGRWSELNNQTGTFVARRPQEFGAALWSFVELAEGKLKRIIDLPLRNYHWRGCDAAWHLQMARDHNNGKPQRYQTKPTSGGVRFDFFSPIPLWAERRLMLLGRECPPEKSLFAYELPNSEADEEEQFLQNNLWLTPVGESNGGVKK